LGITVAIICLTIGAFYCYQKENTRLALWLIIALGIATRIFCSLDPLLHQWDERYHALVSKNMMEHPIHPKLYQEHVIDYDYKNWSANETWLHKQPFPLWFMAFSMKLFGVNEFAVRLPSIFLSSLGIFLLFLIGKYLYNEKVGLIAAFLFAINGLIIELTAGRVATDHFDVFFLCLIELSVCFILLNKVKKNKGFLLLAGISCGLAILSKWLPALIIFPLYIVLNFKDKKISTLLFELIILAVPAIIVAVPWQVYTYTVFPKEYLWEQHFNYLHIVEGLDGHGQPWWYFLDRIRITVNEGIYLVLAWLAYQVFKNKWKREDLFLVVWILIPLIFFSITKTKMQGYILFTFPAYFLAIALFIQFLMDKKVAAPSLKVFYKIIIAAFFILAIRYGFERIKPFASQETALTVKQELQQISFKPNAVVFNVPCPIEIMFYTDVLAYQNPIDLATAINLQEAGYSIYFVNHGSLPSEIKTSDNIKLIELPAAVNYYKNR